MKKRTLVIIIVIVVIFIITITSLDSRGFFTRTIIPLKSQYASFIENDGVITKVKFSGPFSHNEIELYENVEYINRDEENMRIMITYDIEVREALFSSKEPTINIKYSEKIEYVYIFNFSDKTITIQNGRIID